MKIPRLVEWRQRRGLTQEELADSSGVTRVTISKIETGKHSPRVKTARKLATALDVSPGDLMGPSKS